MDANIAFGWEKQTGTAESTSHDTAESVASCDKVNSRDVVESNSGPAEILETTNMTPAKMTPARLDDAVVFACPSFSEEGDTTIAPAPLAKYGSSLCVGVATTDSGSPDSPSMITGMRQKGDMDVEDNDGSNETISSALEAFCEGDSPMGGDYDSVVAVVEDRDAKMADSQLTDSAICRLRQLMCDGQGPIQQSPYISGSPAATVGAPMSGDCDVGAALVVDRNGETADSLSWSAGLSTLAQVSCGQREQVQRPISMTRSPAATASDMPADRLRSIPTAPAASAPTTGTDLQCQAAWTRTGQFQIKTNEKCKNLETLPSAPQSPAATAGKVSTVQGPRITPALGATPVALPTHHTFELTDDSDGLSQTDKEVKLKSNGMPPWEPRSTMVLAGNMSIDERLDRSEELAANVYLRRITLTCQLRVDAEGLLQTDRGRLSESQEILPLIPGMPTATAERMPWTQVNTAHTCPRRAMSTGPAYEDSARGCGCGLGQFRPETT